MFLLTDMYHVLHVNSSTNTSVQHLIFQELKERHAADRQQWEARSQAEIEVPTGAVAVPS